VVKKAVIVISLVEETAERSNREIEKECGKSNGHRSLKKL